MAFCRRGATAAFEFVTELSQVLQGERTKRT
jgi:hypothetical protein